MKLFPMEFSTILFSFVNELKQIRVEPDPKLKIGSLAPSWLNGCSEFSV